MAILDEILERVGVVGSRIQHHQLIIERDRIFFDQPSKMGRTVLVTSDGKRLEFDVAKDINHDFDSTVTSYVVEDSSKISDHVVNENPVFSVEGIFSDARAIENTGDIFEQGEVYRKLKELRDKKETVTLITRLDTYTSLQLTKLSLPVTDGVGASLRVAMQFEQIRKGSNQITEVTIGSGGGKQSGDVAISNASEKDAGVKQPQEDIRGLVNKSTWGVSRGGLNRS